MDELGNPIRKTTLSQTGIFTRSRLKNFHSDLEDSLCKSLKMDFVGIVLDENDLLGKALSFVPHEHLELVNEHFKDKEHQLQEQNKIQTLREQQLHEYARNLDELKYQQDKRDIEFIKEQTEILESIELAKETTNSVKRMATIEEWGAGFTKAIPSFIPNPKVRDIVKSCIEKYISFVNRDVIKAISIAKEALFRKSKSREEISQEVFSKAEEIDKNQQEREFQYKKGGMSR